MISLHNKTKGSVIATRKVERKQFQDGEFLVSKINQRIHF